MTPNIKLFSLLVVLLANTTVAQTTAIPDEGFEQALIDLNIDSDGVVNGQVLTSDIENIIELDFSNLYNVNFNGQEIVDFTGIEDFESLEVINLTNISIDIPEFQSNIFNSNFNLREFRADDLCDDCGPSTHIPYLDISNLANLELISLVNSQLINSINLNNPNLDYENLTIDLSHEAWSPPFTYTVCINVSDAQAASSGQFPYNTWNIITPEPDQNGYVWRDYEFSSTCTLSTTDFETLTSISVYPNPVQDKLWLDNPNQIKIEKAELYTISGQRLRTFNAVNDFIDVESLDTGVYFVRLFGENSTSTFKLLRN